MPTQIEIARHLDMSERNVRDVIRMIGDTNGYFGEWWKTSTLDDIRVFYIKDLREKAAGRGGSSQGDFARARTDESLVKTAKLRLEYQREIKSVVSVEDSADIISKWARQANVDYTQGFNQLVSEIQSKYVIKVDTELVEKIVCHTTERIKDYAAELGRRLIESIDDISEADNLTNR